MGEERVHILPLTYPLSGKEVGLGEGKGVVEYPSTIFLEVDLSTYT